MAGEEPEIRLPDGVAAALDEDRRRHLDRLDEEERRKLLTGEAGV